MAKDVRQDDEFYVGYLERAPLGIARLATVAVVGLLVLGLTAALLLVFAQESLGRATFEYGRYRDFAGFLETDPYPALLVPRPADAGAQPAYSRYLLVGEGKHGADSEVAPYAGQRVALRGSLIYRDGQTMVELLHRSIRPQGPTPVSLPRQVPAGEVTLTGEIVDSKCYLGVMNPGRTKVHRDCAVRCISGGIPLMLLTAGGTYLLVGSDGRKLNAEVLDIVAETIEVRGQLAHSGETMILRAEPAGFRRVTGPSIGMRAARLGE